MVTIRSNRMVSNPSDQLGNGSLCSERSNDSWVQSRHRADQPPDSYLSSAVYKWHWVNKGLPTRPYKTYHDTKVVKEELNPERSFRGKKAWRGQRTTHYYFL